MKRARIYYHLSPVKGLNTIDPRIPDSEGLTAHEPNINRVCVSSSITGCLKALYPIPGDSLYVYSVAVDDDTKFIPNKYVKLIIGDASETGEAWVLESTTAYCEGRIIATDPHKWKWVEKNR